MFRSSVLNLCRFKNPASRSFCVLVKPHSRVLPVLSSGCRVIKNDFHDRKIGLRVEQSLKTYDKIPGEFMLIYRAPYLMYVKTAYVVATISSFFIPCILLSSNVIWGLQEFPINFYGMPLMNNIFEFFGYCAGLLVITCQLGFFAWKYPLRIYADKERNVYIAVYQHLLPWKNTNLYFKKNDVTRVKSFMPWKESIFQFGKRKAILMDSYFISPTEMNEMVNDSFKEE